MGLEQIEAMVGPNCKRCGRCYSREGVAVILKQGKFTPECGCEQIMAWAIKKIAELERIEKLEAVATAVAAHFQRVQIPIKDLFPTERAIVEAMNALAKPEPGGG